MPRLLAASLIASTALISQLANADEDYRFEVTASAADGSLDISEASLDTEATKINASYYFDTVEGDEYFPLAESAYVAKVDSLSLGLETFEANNQNSASETTEFNLEYRLVTEEDKTWRFTLEQSEIDASGSGTPAETFKESSEFTGVGVGFGAYISDSSSFEFSYQKNIYDGDNGAIEDTQKIALNFRSVKAFEESDGFFAFDVDISSEKVNVATTDGNTITTFTTAMIKPEYYFNRNLSVFASLTSVRSRPEHTTNIGLGVNYFLLSGLKLSASYADITPQLNGQRPQDGKQVRLGLSFRI